MPLSLWLDNLIERYLAGYIEVLTSLSTQITYLCLGFLVEQIRPTYVTETSRKMVVQSLRNQVVTTMLHVAFVLSRGGESLLTRTFIRPYSLPSWGEFVSDLVVAMLLRDIGFYLIHRLWHVPGIYEWVHAKHHEIERLGNHHVWTISYMTVVDFLLLYGMPVVAIAKLLEMNLLTTSAFAMVAASGEQVRLACGDEEHEEHHLGAPVNYGVLGVMDGLFRTTSEAKRKANKVE